MKEECKRHKWRVGSNNAILLDGKIVRDTLNIWCEKCDRKIKAKYRNRFKSARILEKDGAYLKAKKALARLSKNLIT